MVSTGLLDPGDLSDPGDPDSDSASVLVQSHIFKKLWSCSKTVDERSDEDPRERDFDWSLLGLLATSLSDCCALISMIPVKL